jgi:hypothetical protein
MTADEPTNQTPNHHPAHHGHYHGDREIGSTWKQKKKKAPVLHGARNGSWLGHTSTALAMLANGT